MGKLVKLLGSGIGYTSDAIQAARNRPSSKSFTCSTAPRHFPAGGNGECAITKVVTPDALIQEGYAELPASPIHHECVELPGESRHGVHAELPASPMDREIAELPGASVSARESHVEPFAVSDEKFQKQVSQSDTQKSEQEWEPVKPHSISIEHSELNYSNRLQRGIEPDVAYEQHDQTTQHVGLPTYSESEHTAAARFDVTASSRGEEDEEQRQEYMTFTLVQMAGPSHIRNRIPSPVIIPQIRSGYFNEGFVRAYAPVLADCGISQDVFTSFQDYLCQTSEAANSIEVTSIAANIVGEVPETASLITGSLVQIAAGTALETNHCRDTFLDRVNQELFMPRGLCALVVAFKDKVEGPQHGRLGPLSRKHGETIFAREKLEFDQPPANGRLVKGCLDGQIRLPQAAPLVYPDLNLPMTEFIKQGRLRKQKGSSGSHGACQKLKVAGVWVQDYVEKKAQESKQYQSCGVNPEPMRGGLISRSPGPSHPANNGKLISALSGGRLGNKPGLIKRAANSIRESQDSKRGIEFPNGLTQERRSGYRGQTGPQTDVQHLFIVNMPTADEVQQSVALLELLLQQTGQVAAHGNGK